MQYKIPVQIENEDTIFLNLSLRQIGIITIGGGIGYSVFKSLEAGVGPGVAAIPWIFIFAVTVLIALFRNSEMTFLPFLLNMIRLNLNSGIRMWNKGTESFSSLEIGYVTSMATAKKKMETKGDFSEVADTVNENLSKL